MSSLRRGIFAVPILNGALLAGALVAVACLALPPSAGAAGRPADVRLLAQAAGAVSADEAAARVRAASGGRILDVRLDETAQPPVYRVKVLLDGGRVRVYRVDAGTGSILP